MRLLKKSNGSLSENDYDITDDLEAEVASIVLQRIDEASAVPMPDEIEKLWSDPELNQLAEEQEPRWQAKGEVAARPATITAEGLGPAAKGGQTRIDLHEEKFKAAVTRSITVEEVLGWLTRREPHAKFWYVLRFVALVLGDIAGISGAAILLGEIVALAIMQAIAAGIAAVTAGIIGHDIRDMVLARRRQRDDEDLSADELPFRHLFQGAHAGEGIIKMMVWVAVTVALLTAGAIFALRTGVEGSNNGLIFAGLAGAICLASALNTYMYADEVADLIERANLAEQREDRRHQKLANQPKLRRFGEAKATAQSIKEEHRLRGLAAVRHIRALKWRVYRQNPGVVGHGPARPTQLRLFSEPEPGHHNGVRPTQSGG